MNNGNGTNTVGGSIYQINYWPRGEHIMGHEDRLILGVDEILIEEKSGGN